MSESNRFTKVRMINIVLLAIILLISSTYLQEATELIQETGFLIESQRYQGLFLVMIIASKLVSITINYNILKVIVNYFATAASFSLLFCFLLIQLISDLLMMVSGSWFLSLLSLIILVILLVKYGQLSYKQSIQITSIYALVQIGIELFTRFLK